MVTCARFVVGHLHINGTLGRKGCLNLSSSPHRGRQYLSTTFPRQGWQHVWDLSHDSIILSGPLHGARPHLSVIAGLAFKPVEHSGAMAVSDNDAYEESQVDSSTVEPPLSPRSPRPMRQAALRSREEARVSKSVRARSHPWSPVELTIC